LESSHNVLWGVPASKDHKASWEVKTADSSRSSEITPFILK